MPHDQNPRDDMPADQREYEKWEAERGAGSPQIKAEVAALEAKLAEAEKLVDRWRWAAQLPSTKTTSKAQQCGWSQAADELAAILGKGENSI